MLTIHKLAIYARFDGDIDGFVRAGSAGSALEKKAITAAEWSLIDSFLQDIHLQNNGLLSDVYLINHEANMLAACAGEKIVTKPKLRSSRVAAKGL